MCCISLLYIINTIVLEINNKQGYHPLGDAYGYYIGKLPQEIIEDNNFNIKEIENDFKNNQTLHSKLEGEIEHEYIFPVSNLLKSYIVDLVDKYDKESNHLRKWYPNVNLEFSMPDVWVNFQKKHEYNPMHHHSGIFSWVIWHKIPYYFKDELNTADYKKIKKINSDGQFVFYNIESEKRQIKTYHMNIDKHMENTICIFPSSLNHAVYPFYSSDEYRITISGNVRGII
jgi:hypothetical protein